MAQELINIGTANAKQGDTLFDAFTKVNNNFTDVFGNQKANVVVVNDESDFPEAVAGVITLADNTIYEIGATIETDNRFECGNANIITSGNPFATPLIYTGTGTMFTGVNVSFALDRILILCPNSQAFDFSATAGASPTFGLNLVAVQQCQKCATLDNLRSINITNASFFNCTSGFTVEGTDNWDTLSIARMRIASTSVITGLDLTNSVHRTFEISDYTIEAPATSTGLSGLASSGNIQPDFIAAINRCEFPPTVTPLNGITQKDIRYSFFGNSGIADSTVDANPYLTTTTTVTINTAGVYEKINQNNWSFADASRLSVSADGDITNLLEQAIKVQITGTATVDKVGGGSDLITALFAYNDDPTDPSSLITEVGTNNTQPTNVALTGIFTLQPGDSISVWVANQDSTSDVIVDYCKFTLLRVL